MKRVSITIILLLCLNPSVLTQSLDNSLTIISKNDSITQLTVYGFGVLNKYKESHPIPYRIDIDSHYKRIDVGRNSLLITYRKGQSIQITISEENNGINSPIQQISWEKVYLDFEDNNRYTKILLESNLAIMNARLKKNEISLLQPFLGKGANHYCHVSSHYTIIKGDRFDTFVDKGPLSLCERTDSSYLYRIRIPTKWKRIYYSNQLNSVIIKYSRGQFIQLSYSNLIKENTVSDIQYSKVSREDGRDIHSSIKRNPCRNDVAAYIEGTMRDGAVYLTILAKKNNIEKILNCIMETYGK